MKHYEVTIVFHEDNEQVKYKLWAMSEQDAYNKAWEKFPLDEITITQLKEESVCLH